MSTENTETKEDSPKIVQREIEEFEDFYERPVLIGLGIFVLIVVGVLLAKSPTLEEVPSLTENENSSEQEIEAVVIQNQKEKSIKKNIPDSSFKDKIKRISRLGKPSLPTEGLPIRERDCLFSIDAGNYSYLSEAAMNKRGLSGVSAIEVITNTEDTGLAYRTQKLPRGCSRSFSFSSDRIIISPAENSDTLSGHFIQLTKTVEVDTSFGTMFWVFPNTRLRLKLHEKAVPKGKQKLIVRGIYLGGDLKSSTTLLQGSQKVTFSENDGVIFAEVDFQANTKWSMIVAPVRDFVLINYIAFRGESGETVILDSSGG